MVSQARPLIIEPCSQQLILVMEHHAISSHREKDGDEVEGRQEGGRRAAGETGCLEKWKVERHAGGLEQQCGV